MSKSISISITLEKHNLKQIKTMKIIQALIKYGWTLYHNGYINYKPLGSEDWVVNILDLKSLAGILTAKEANREIIGIMMKWRLSDTGGDFLFWPEEGTYEAFSLSVNPFRPEITLADNYEVTDFQWYLEKLLPPLNDLFGVKSFLCEEHR